MLPKNREVILIVVNQDWFDDASTRRDVDRAVRTVMCSRESVHPADIRTTHQNVQVVRDGRASEVRRAIVLWDKVGGGLGLSKAVADNLGKYTQALLEIARSSGQRSERERLLKEDTAALHRWAAAVAPHTLGPEQTPAITEYGGVTFRSQLEARWAAYFDRRGIAWEYEPARFDGWTPDFRLLLDGPAGLIVVNHPSTELPNCLADLRQAGRRVSLVAMCTLISPVAVATAGQKPPSRRRHTQHPYQSVEVNVVLPVTLTSQPRVTSPRAPLRWIWASPPHPCSAIGSSRASGTCRRNDCMSSSPDAFRNP